MAASFTFTISDILTLVADIVNLTLLVMAVIGIFLTRHQIKQSYDVQKATFFKEIYLTLLREKNIRDAFYLVEKNKFIFDKNMLGTQTEKNVDALLCFFDMVCRLYLGKMLTKQELYDFEYELTVIFNNSEIQKYLTHINNIYGEKQMNGKPFMSFVFYCKNVLRVNYEDRPAKVQLRQIPE